MTRESEPPSAARKWWLLLGAVVLFVVTFDFLERLTGPEPSQSTTGADATADTSGAQGPSPPVLRKTEDGAIEIRLDIFRRTTIRLDSDAQRDAVYDCLEKGFDEAFGDGTEGWTARRVRRETQRIQNECLTPVPGLQVPPLPSPPTPER